MDCIYTALLVSGHSNHFTLLPNIHLFIDTFTHWWRCVRGLVWWAVCRGWTDLEPLDLCVLGGPLRVLLREEELHGHHGGAAAFQLQNLAQVLVGVPGRARSLKNKTRWKKGTIIFNNCTFEPRKCLLLTKRRVLYLGYRLWCERPAQNEVEATFWCLFLSGFLLFLHLVWIKSAWTKQHFVWQNKLSLCDEDLVTYLLLQALDGRVLLGGLLLKALQEPILLVQHLGEPFYFLRGVENFILQQLHLGGTTKGCWF